MANITAERSVVRYGAEVGPLVSKLNLPMAASTKIFKGGLVSASNLAASKGQAVKAGAALSQTVVGIALATVDNSAGSAGALSIEVQPGVWWMGNSSAGDAIDLQHIGMPCYVVDDQTVALTDNGGARVKCGTILQVDSTLGVLVEIGPGVASDGAGSIVVPLAVDLTTASNATLLTFTPQFNGRVKKISLSVSKAGVGAGATCTITPNIAGAPLTGGVLTPTLANTTLGAEVAATSITGANYFTAGQAITLVGSATTAFTAGSGTIYLHLG